MPDELPPLTREQVRRVDAIAIERYGMPGILLMENAGRGAAELLRSLGADRVAVCCGRGNNGGDGFVIARHLANAGRDVRVLLFADPKDLRGDAAVNFAALGGTDVPRTVLAGDLDHETLVDALAGSRWIVDALLGTGATGLPRPPYPEVIRAINTAAAGAGVKVLAVDLPSGLDADAGEPFRDGAGRYGPCVKADVTATFVARKVGFDKPSSREFTGEVVVIDIGVPEAVIEEARMEERGSKVEKTDSA